MVLNSTSILVINSMKQTILHGLLKHNKYVINYQEAEQINITTYLSICQNRRYRSEPCFEMFTILLDSRYQGLLDRQWLQADWLFIILLSYWWSISICELSFVKEIESVMWSLITLWSKKQQRKCRRLKEKERPERMRMTQRGREREKKGFVTL